MEYDPDFYQFMSPKLGIRAMARILINYQKLYYLDTVRKLIARWAPADDDNPSDLYADFVAIKLGIDKDAPIDVSTYLVDMVKAMIEFENGQNPYCDETITSGVLMAQGVL
jgi:hypothetical protein